MTDTRYPPELELKKTLSHPLEQVRVAGFQARDTLYGQKAVVLKSREIPYDDEAGVFGLFSEVEELINDGRVLHILGDNTVYTAPTESLGMKTHTFETDLGEITCLGVPVEGLIEYERDEVEVSM